MPSGNWVTGAKLKIIKLSDPCDNSGTLWCFSVGVNRDLSILYGIHISEISGSVPPPPPPLRLWLQLKGIQEQELIAPGDRTTLKSAFQSTATTLNFSSVYVNCEMNICVGAVASSESVIELVVRWCGTFRMSATQEGPAQLPILWKQTYVALVSYSRKLGFFKATRRGIEGNRRLSGMFPVTFLD